MALRSENVPAIMKISACYLSIMKIWSCCPKNLDRLSWNNLATTYNFFSLWLLSTLCTIFVGTISYILLIYCALAGPFIFMLLLHFFLFWLYIYTNRKACFTLCYIDVSVRFDLLMLCSGHDLSYGFKLVPSKLV